MVGLSDRPSTSRQLSNFYLKAPGEACLLLGLKDILDFQDKLIQNFNGRLYDSWAKRIDLCLDLPQLSVKSDLNSAYLDQRFVTSASAWGAYSSQSGPSGFSFGGGKSGLRLNIYDKLAQTRSRGSDYQQAMVQYRWGESWPSEATRVEYQIRKVWLDNFSFLSAPEVLNRLGDITKKVTSEGPRPFFRFTETKPDRENGHQSRAETLHLWRQLSDIFRKGFDSGVKPLERLQRGNITSSRAFSLIRGYLTKAAAVSGIKIESLEDAQHYLKSLHQGMWSSNEEWLQAWQRHATKTGTIDSAKPVGGHDVL